MEPSAAPVLPYATNEHVRGQRMLMVWSLIAGAVYTLKLPVTWLTSVHFPSSSWMPMACSFLGGLLILAAATAYILPYRGRRRCLLAGVCLVVVYQASSAAISLGWLSAQTIPSLERTTQWLAAIFFSAEESLCCVLLGWMFAGRHLHSTDIPSPAALRREQLGTGLWLILLGLYLAVVNGTVVVMSWGSPSIQRSLLLDGDLSGVLVFTGVNMLAGSALCITVAGVGWLSGRRWARNTALATWVVVATCFAASSAIAARRVLSPGFAPHTTARVFLFCSYTLLQLLSWVTPLWIGRPGHTRASAATSAIEDPQERLAEPAHAAWAANDPGSDTPA